MAAVATRRQHMQSASSVLQIHVITLMDVSLMTVCRWWIDNRVLFSRLTWREPVLDPVQSNLSHTRLWCRMSSLPIQSKSQLLPPHTSPKDVCELHKCQ